MPISTLCGAEDIATYSPLIDHAGRSRVYPLRYMGELIKEQDLDACSLANEGKLIRQGIEGAYLRVQSVQDPQGRPRCSCVEEVRQVLHA